MNTIVLYTADPGAESLSMVNILLHSLKRNGFFIHGLFDKSTLPLHELNARFDEYTFLNDKNIDKTLTHYSENHINILFTASLAEKKYLAKMFSNFAVISILMDYRYGCFQQNNFIFGSSLYCPGHSIPGCLLCFLLSAIKPSPQQIITSKLLSLIKESDLILTAAPSITKKLGITENVKELPLYADFKKKYRKPERKKKYVIYIPGIHGNEKEIMVCIDVLAEYRERWHLIIDDRSHKSYKLRNYLALSDSSDFVEFADPERSKDDFFMYADLVAVPDYSGLGYIEDILTGLSYGRAFISSVSEVLHYMGNACFIADPFDYTSLAQLLNSFEQNSSIIERAGEQGYYHYIDHFSELIFIKKIKAIIDECSK